jgi:hypothetical protein
MKAVYEDVTVCASVGRFPGLLPRFFEECLWDFQRK